MEISAIRINNLGGNPYWVSASDIYKFALRPDKKGVGNWLKLHSTINLIGNITSLLHTDTENLHKFTPGRNGSTWLHWYLALEYAAYIDLSTRLNVEIYLTNLKVVDRRLMDLLNSEDLYSASEVGWLTQEYKKLSQEYVRTVTEKGTYNYQDLSLVTSLCLQEDAKPLSEVSIDSDKLRARNDLQRLINNKLKTNKEVKNLYEVRQIMRQTSIAWLNFQSALNNQTLPEDALDKIKSFPNLR